MCLPGQSREVNKLNAFGILFGMSRRTLLDKAWNLFELENPLSRVRVISVAGEIDCR